MSDTETPLHVLILQHEEPTPPGLVTGWLDAHGAEVDVVRIDVDDREVDPNSYDLIVSLGSEFAAFDDHKPFVPREARLMEKAVQDDVPVLGLCFGGQMLARVLGGEVSRGDIAEIGWLPVRTTDPELVPQGPWLNTSSPTTRLSSDASALSFESHGGGTSSPIGLFDSNVERLRKSRVPSRPRECVSACRLAPAS